MDEVTIQMIAAVLPAVAVLAVAALILTAVNDILRHSEKDTRPHT